MKPIFWLFLIFMPTLLFSQEEDQSKSMSEKYLDLGYELKNSNTDSALYYFNLAYSYAKKEHNEDALYEILIGKAEVFDQKGDVDSSQFYHDWLLDSVYTNHSSIRTKAEILYSNSHYLKTKNEFFQALSMLDSAAYFSLELNDSLYYADVLNRIGSIYEDMGRRSGALEKYLEALEIYELYDDEKMYGNMINNIAISFKKAGDLENAMRYYNTSVELLREQNDTDSEAITRVNRGLLHKDLGQYKAALNDLHFSLNYFQQNSYLYGIAVCQHNLGETHLKFNKLDSSLFYLNKSQKQAEEFDFTPLLIKNNLALAKLNRKQSAYLSSNQYAKRAYNLAAERKSTEDLSEINLILSDNYSDLRDYQKALRHFREYKQSEDSLLSKESRWRLNVLRTEYDLKYKEDQIEALQAKNELQSNLANEQKKTNTLLIIGFIVTIAFLILVLWLYRYQKALSKKLTTQKGLLIEQKEEIESAQEQIVAQNETLVKLNKEKDNLMAIVAHDLRSPLNQIRGVLGLVKMENNSKSADQYIDIANQSSEVLSERINRILDIEAINKGKVNLKTERLEIRKILEFLQQNIRSIAIQKNMNLIIDSVNNVSCLADENYLLQVLENLCTNAIKYSPEKSEIKITVSSEERNVLFSVKDQGPGISDKEISSLFLPYSKTSNKPTGNETSIGLGLAIVKKYVEAMDGEVWVESEVNKGSVFYVKIPKAA